MNRRPLWLRTLLSLWGIWFATALIEPAGFLGCPMHSGGAVAAASGHVAAHDAPRGEGGHDHHTAPPTASPTGHHGAAAGSDHGPAPDAPHHCTCLGHCCAVTGHAIATRGERWLPSVQMREARASMPTYVARLATPVAYLRPFANGPPERIG